MPKIAPSRGTHVTLSIEDLPLNEAACIVPAGADRTIFVLPWYGRVLVGTTDNDYDGDIDHVRPGGDDIAYLLDAVNNYFGTTLGRDDLTGAYAGVRPLISTGDPKKSVDISRKAELYETSSGMLTITGGKLTTWRRMAKSVVDRIAMREDRELPCHTAEIPLGMEARDADLDPPAGVDPASLPDGWRELLAFRYGHAARDVLAAAAERPELARPIVAGQPDMLAEVGDRRPPRAGSRPRRRPAAPDPARTARRAAAAHAGVGGGGGPGARNRARLGPLSGSRPRPPAGRTSSPTRGPTQRVSRRPNRPAERRGPGPVGRAAYILPRRMAPTLEKQHLSELHRLAAGLGIERYRMLPRDELDRRHHRTRPRRRRGER